MAPPGHLAVLIGALALGLCCSAGEAALQCPGQPVVALCAYGSKDSSIDGYSNSTLYIDGSWKSLETTLVQHKPRGVLIQALNVDEGACKPGMLLPLFMSEDMWNPYLRAILYLIALLWCFVGVAIIADQFMAAIEVITSTEKTVSYVDPKTRANKTMKVLVWNETIANLTLMALGSSAPEILLAIIETVGQLGEPPSEGGLGPSTIVGSAAFNLLMILAICVVSLPAGETRKVKELGVFSITSFASIFAYVWLLFVLSWNSENEVEWWEALLTLLMFPILVGVSYAADRGWCRGSKAVKPSGGWITGTGGMGAQGYGQHDIELANTPAQRRDSGILHKPRKVSRAQYRINGIRQLSGGARVYVPQRRIMEMEEQTRLAAKKALQSESKADERPESTRSLLPPDSVEISFSTSTYGAYEHQGRVTLHVVRVGCLGSPVAVQFETSNGTALAGEDYEFTSGVLHFGPEQQMSTIEVPIHDDDKFEGDENFFCTLKLVPERLAPVGAPKVLFGRYPTTEVTIIDDDHPGIFSFQSESMTVPENCGSVDVVVERSKGSDGVVVLKYRTKDGTAVAPKDYIASNGTITFKHGELQKVITLEIVDDNQYEKEESFSVIFEILNQDACGAEFGDHSQTIVNITNDEEFKKLVDKMAVMINLNLDKLKVRTESWAEQYRSAMSVHTDGIDAQPAAFDYLMHFLSFFWKVLFAAVPPTSIMGGWLAFTIALIFIGGVTILVGDIASTFGCTIGFPDGITAITFVALGTSLPDTFASRAAALNDAHADAAVGNVTGSNSVNVFLGLGLPWTIAAIYHAAQGTPYKVSAGSLSFSVLVFCVCATLCIITMYIRRLPAVAGGELGGGKACKYFTGGFFTLLWFAYITLSSLKSLDKI